MAVNAASVMRPMRAAWGPAAIAAQFAMRDIAVRFFQGFVQVIGDASGGLATLDLQFPRDSQALFFVRKLSVRGNPDVSLSFGVTGQFEVVPGVSWVSQEMELVTGGTGIVRVQDLDAAARVISPLFWQAPLMAFGTPGLQAVWTNVTAATYRIACIAARVDRTSWNEGLRVLLPY